MQRSQFIEVAVCVAAFTMMLAGGASVVPSRAVEYRLDPPLTNVAPGQVCTLSVVAGTPGDSLGCVESWITFDPALVTLMSGKEGTLFTNAGVGRLFFNHAIAPDTFSVEGCLLGYRTYTLTPGELARFVFRADAVGVCPVRIVRFNLWDIDRVLFEPVLDPNAWIVIGNPTDVRPRSLGELGVSAHPNPFNPSTTVEIRARPGERVRLDVHSAAGRLVRRLFQGEMRGDTARFPWDGSDAAGVRMPSGVYFVSVAAGESRVTRKIVLIK